MPEGRVAEVRGQGRQEAATAGRALTLTLAATAAVLAPAAASAAEPYIGRWIVDPEFCKEIGDTADTMPLIIRAKTMEWFVARCTYRGATRKGGQWIINARCSAEGERGPIRILLRPKDDRLVVQWDGGKAELMQRCP
jgi:hypothetical protein